MQACCGLAVLRSGLTGLTGTRNQNKPQQTLIDIVVEPDPHCIAVQAAQGDHVSLRGLDGLCTCWLELLVEVAATVSSGEFIGRVIKGVLSSNLEHGRNFLTQPVWASSGGDVAGVGLVLPLLTERQRPEGQCQPPDGAHRAHVLRSPWETCDSTQEITRASRGSRLYLCRAGLGEYGVHVGTTFCSRVLPRKVSCLYSSIVRLAAWRFSENPAEQHVGQALNQYS